jgi:integrase/recombinase XerD
MRRIDRALVCYLGRDEIRALLDAPDPKSPSGLRDRAMLHLAFAAGLRVSELVGLRLDQLERGSAPCVHVMGKGRRERVPPLWKKTASVIAEWLKARKTAGDPELFLNAAGRAMTRSGFEYILAKHVAAAARTEPSIAGKCVTPHVPRHSCGRQGTSARSRCGLAMPVCKARKPTCARTRPKSWKPSPPWHRPACDNGSSKRPTRSRPC